MAISANLVLITFGVKLDIDEVVLSKTFMGMPLKITE
jgi:hypothetical protein